MSDFPRGWVLTNWVAGGAASIAVPATPGVTHVLDSFSASTAVAATGTANFGPVIRVSSSDGAFSSYPIGYVVVNLATLGAIDRDSESGMDLAAGPGASLTIAFDSSNGSCETFLRILGHDI